MQPTTRKSPSAPMPWRHFVTVASFLTCANQVGACSSPEVASVCPSGLRCPVGEQCAANQDVCIADGCGDGMADPLAGEMCDDGNIVGGDGCSADCRSDETCGNGTIDGELGEACDGGPGCNGSCQRFGSCGNGVTDPGEDCDSHGVETPRCNRDCTRARCGDDRLNRSAGEQCDTGGDSATCDRDCTVAACGDGHHNPYHGFPGEECDGGRETGVCDIDCTLAQCGDGYHNRVAEVCDDDGDSPYCTAACEPGPWCDATCSGDGDCLSGRCIAGLCQPARLAAGRDHTCVVMAYGAVRCWGYGHGGRLGYGSGDNIGDNETPRAVGDVPIAGQAALIQVVAGDAHTCALAADGSVRCWGEGSLGRLGYGDENDVGGLPGDQVAAVALGDAARQIAVGRAHTCALLDTGAVRCWGDNAFGQLGRGDRINIGDDETPEQVGDVEIGGAVVQIAAGARHTCALLDHTGAVRCWGANDHGQLGYGDTQAVGDGQIAGRERPADVGDIALEYPTARAVQIAAGAWHTCALLDTGAVKCWGLGSDGRLGYGHVNNVGDTEMPGDVEASDLGGDAVQIAAGMEHTCALIDTGATGEVRCWGRGSDGRLGHRGTDNIGDDELPSAALPIDVGGWPGSAPVEIRAGGHHTCVLLDTCSVRCWGDGALGRLGLGHTRTIGDDEAPATTEPVFFR